MNVNQARIGDAKLHVYYSAQNVAAANRTFKNQPEMESLLRAQKQTNLAIAHLIKGLGQEINIDDLDKAHQINILA
jgi:hypothetical protein